MGPVTISAYGDTNGIPSYIQGALSSTGIGLNHIPAGAKDASDKKILVDMLFWVVDNPAPANYLLISGDRDFSNAIHQLRMRTYNVLLAQLFKAYPALAAAATNVIYTDPISEPISANQPTNSNANANINDNAFGAQNLSNLGRYFDSKTKATYIPKNSNQQTMISMSSMTAKTDETSSNYCPHAPASDGSENHNIQNKPAQCTQSQPLLVPNNIVKSNSRQNLRPPAPRPLGRGDLCGSINKGDVRPKFSFLLSSLGVSKSVCLIKFIFLALNTLKIEKIVPTKENIGYCIRYDNPNYRHTDVTVALNTALEQQMILKLGQVDFELYIGRTERIWPCEIPLGGNPNLYQDATWSTKILRNTCLKDLTLGEVLHILNMIITLKRWIKTRSYWQPITITLPETNNDKDTRTS
ncbi:unnamed protein product [Withania somnifera]